MRLDRAFAHAVERFCVKRKCGALAEKVRVLPVSGIKPGLSYFDLDK